VVVTTVGGPVVTIAGPPKSYKVKSGDNIDAIARTLGTTRAQLVKDNDLKAPYRIHPGLVLQGPETKDAKAYVVQTGDTMFAIAKRFSVSAAALAEENELSTGSAIKKGQKLRLPDGYRDKGPSRTTVMQAVAQEPATRGPARRRPAACRRSARRPAARPLRPARSRRTRPRPAVRSPPRPSASPARWSRSPARAAATPSSPATRSTRSPAAWTPPAPTWSRTTT
jgi:LysM repeat protein